MKTRIGSVMAAAVALAMLNVTSVGAASTTAPNSPPGTVGLVAQATRTGVANLVRTTALGTGTYAYGGAQALPSSIPPGAGPRTFSAGDNASSRAKVPASISNSQGKGRPSSTPYPTVTGSPITGATSGLTSTSGLNGYLQGITHPQNGGLPGVDAEPSDQGLCASTTTTMEVNNEVVEVFSGSKLSPITIAPLERLFGTPEIFGAGGDGSYSVQGDPRCYFDSTTGRWYASQIWLDLNNATPQGWAGTWLAVSKTPNPTGSWNVYFIPDLSNQTETASCNNLPISNSGANPCFGDQPLLGVGNNTVQISTNEYSIFGNAPAGQCNYYFLSKAALDSGAASVPVWWNAIGDTVSAPGAGPWYSLVPAQSPAGSYPSAYGGTSYALSALDFSNAGDQRIAEWAFTNTSAVNSPSSNPAPIGIYEATLSSGQYAMPPLATQKAGPTPLGDAWNTLNGINKAKAPPEGPIQTNDDRMATAAFDPSTGALVGALNTGVLQVSGTSQTLYSGIAYFTVTPKLDSSGLVPSTVSTGYLSPSGANAFFPAVAVTPKGAGVMTYGISGTGYYPSTAYSMVGSSDTVGSTVHVAALGIGPQDGFSEYQGLGTSSYDPRWGDYSAAQVVGNRVVFASEMINQSCTDTTFAQDFTCGGTRDLFINWGTSVNLLTP